MRILHSTLVALAAVLATATAAAAATTTLSPTASGTIQNMPELGIFGPAPVGDAVQSSYFRTTSLNREFRRGITEFAIPALTSVTNATLVLRETRATIGFPVPPDIHELSSYSPADLAITTADYDRAASLVGTLATDSNLEPQTFTFDVTSLVLAAAGGTLGFRVQLAVDPAYAAFASLGSGFDVTLVIVTPVTIPDIVAAVDALEGSGAVNNGVANALRSKLSAAQASLASGNTTAARNQLRAFVNQLEALVRSGQLTPAQAQPLIDAAQALLATV